MKILKLLFKYRYYIFLCLSFLLLWRKYEDINFAFRFTVFYMGMLTFNLNIIYAYRAFKSNRFNFKRAKEELNWPYFCISTPLVVIVFILLFHGSIWLFYAWFVSAGLLAMLFVYDLIVNGFK